MKIREEIKEKAFKQQRNSMKPKVGSLTFLKGK